MAAYRAPDNSAEYYRGFLLYLLREKFRAQGPYNIRSEESIKSNKNLEGYGISFIFWSAYEDANVLEKQDQIYPLYVGITGQSFKQRFLEHCNDGVVSKINNGEWPSSGGIRGLPGIVAYVLSVDLPVAKFLESTFLFTFNFVMNKEENEQVRPQLADDSLAKAQSLENGLKTFLHGYEYMKHGVEEADKRTRDLKEGSMNQHYYQF